MGRRYDTACNSYRMPRRHWRRGQQTMASLGIIGLPMAYRRDAQFTCKPYFRQNRA